MITTTTYWHLLSRKNSPESSRIGGEKTLYKTGFIEIYIRIYSTGRSYVNPVDSILQTAFRSLGKRFASIVASLACFATVSPLSRSWPIEKTYRERHREKANKTHNNTDSALLYTVFFLYKVISIMFWYRVRINCFLTVWEGIIIYIFSYKFTPPKKKHISI